MFGWVDFETSGLNPDSDVPLAVGAILTDNNLKELMRYEWVVRWQSTSWAIEKMPQVVRDMHTKNGLLEKVFSDSAKPIGVVDREFFDFLNLDELKGETFYMAGSSVHFDRMFARRWLPKTYEKFHYRILDVSTLKVIANTWGAGQMPKEGDKNHTPLLDLERSIREFKHWQKVLFKEGFGP